jgi:hypothetical protein
VGGDCKGAVGAETPQVLSTASAFPLHDIGAFDVLAAAQKAPGCLWIHVGVVGKLGNGEPSQSACAHQEPQIRRQCGYSAIQT